MASWLPSAISALAGLGSSALGISASRQAEDRAWARNLQLMKSQNDFNINMWNSTNRYNSPSNQMRLLKEAGINPALFDANGGNSTASEVTAASADVPNNSQIGQLYQSLDPSQKVIQALTYDAQIAKLRADTKYQELRNRDLENEINARESPYMFDPYYLKNKDDYGFNESDSFYTWKYHNEVDREGYNRMNERRMFLRNSAEDDVYQAGVPFFKQMPKHQLESLLQDVKKKISDNTILDSDVELMKKYGISPHDRDGWQSFLRIALRNPDAFTNVIRTLLGEVIPGTVGTFLSSNYKPVFGLVDRVNNFVKGFGNSHRNPKLRP